ncbi:hypothetical protein [Agathobaculum butyriciproducens]
MRDWSLSAEVSACHCCCNCVKAVLGIDTAPAPAAMLPAISAAAHK